MVEKIKRFFGNIICKFVGCNIGDASIVDEWTCSRCGYHHEKIEWPRPKAEVNCNNFDDAS